MRGNQNMHLFNKQRNPKQTTNGVGKRICALMSIETHACLSEDYEAEMAEVEREAQAYREKKKASRRRRAQYENRGEQDCSISQETHTESSAELSGSAKG